MRSALKHDVELSQNVQTCRAVNGHVNIHEKCPKSLRRPGHFIKTDTPTHSCQGALLAALGLGGNAVIARR